MTVEFAPTWLDDIRSSWWWNKFEAKDPSAEQTSDGEWRWTYADEDGSALYPNLAEEILSVNEPFLLAFADQGQVWSALGIFALSNLDDAHNGDHCKAIVSEEPGDVLTVEQGMHQPQDDHNPHGGFELHVTVRLTSTHDGSHGPNVGKARHAYLMQNQDGSLYVTRMT